MTTVPQPSNAPQFQQPATGPAPAPLPPAPPAPGSTPSWLAPAVCTVAVAFLFLTGVVAAVVVHSWPGAQTPLTVMAEVAAVPGSLAALASLFRKG
ncbi:hypothetical protein [Streptomyces sp. NBC_00102]|uniref:hypothetical protein n=1 Tax=Streptomyces sp. NBC_00102 TaxID=2975652 RepID=UPI0022525D59|nr:hypothetical protein [Streptomyces sp. NBC_00102]MCX5401991.1 hypothetical protein [Streptomyces sp. NBC_00102]